MIDIHLNTIFKKYDLKLNFRSASECNFEEDSRNGMEGPSPEKKSLNFGAPALVVLVLGMLIKLNGPKGALRNGLCLFGFDKSVHKLGKGNHEKGF